jgi:ubiquinone/menaquinone biosynthesis C-methylase UbiE
VATDKKELSRRAFSRDAADYDRSPKYASLRSKYHFVVEEALRRPFRTVLDVGCGTGALLALIRAQRMDAQLCGIDLSEEMVRVAKEKLDEEVELKVSDSEKLPFEDQRFDLVTCTGSFHHYPNPRAVLKEMRRVLSSNGRLLLGDPSVFPPLHWLMNLFVPFSKDGTVRYYSRNEMVGLVESAGFKVIRWRKLDWHSYVMLAEKMLISEP